MSLSPKAFRWIGVTAISVFALAGMAVAAAYFHVQSDSFRASLATQLSSITGQEIELGDQVVIRQLFPSPTIGLPNARLIAREGTVRRARFEGLEIALSPKTLFSSGREGTVSVSANRISVITSADDSDNNTVAGESETAAAPPDLVALLTPLVSTIKTLHAEVSIDTIDLIVRENGAGSSRHVLNDVTMSAAGKRISLEGSLHDAMRAAHRAQLVIDELALVDDATGNRITGRVELALARLSEDATPWRFTTALQVEPHAIELPTLELKSPVAWLRGQLGVAIEAGKQRLLADLELRQLELNALLADSPEDQTVVKPPRQRLFTQDALALTIPASVQADVTLRLGAIRMGSVPIANGQLRLAVDAGRATLSSDELSILGGPAELQVDLDNATPTHHALRVRLEATAMQLSRLRAGIDQEAFISKGEADVIVSVKGSGASSAEIAGTLNGYVLGSINEAEINQKYSTALDRGVVSWASDRLRQATTSAEAAPVKTIDLSDPLSIRCGAVRLYINDGRAEASNGLIVELPDNTLYSSGYVDLSAEEMAFAFRTRSRSLFDWSLISIIKYAEVSGPLAGPSFTLNAVELAKQGLLTVTSAVLGPVPSLVYSLAEAGVNNSRSRECDVALR